MENSADRDSGNYEDVCFICKEVGYGILMCDDPDCPKAYHTECLGMNDDCIPDPWSCDLHSCLICHKSSEFNCLCCTKAFCRECIVRVKFVQIKEKYGLCSFCLKNALSVEQNMDADSDMGYLSFFRDYWKIVKEKESLTSENLRSADARMKSGQWCIYGSDLDEHDKHVDINMSSEFYSTDGGEASSVEKMDESVELERKAKSVHEEIAKHHEEIVAIGEGARVANQHSANRDDSERINEFEDIPGDEKGKESSGDSVDNVKTQSPNLFTVLNSKRKRSEDENVRENLDGVDNIQTHSSNLFPVLNFKRKRSEAEYVRENLDGVMRTDNSAATRDPTLAEALDILHVMAEEIEEINPFTSLYHFSEQYLIDKDKRTIFVTSPTNQTRLASLRYNYEVHLRGGGI